jgi:hypothetical protein
VTVKKKDILVSDETPYGALMIRIFDDAAINGVSGVAYYQPEFDEIS